MAIIQVDSKEAAKLLVHQHGRDADLVAARHADVMFRDGNTTEGTRWLEIFRRIAMSHSVRSPNPTKMVAQTAPAND